MKIKLINVCSLIRKRLLFAIMKTFILLFCTTVFSFNVEYSFSQEKVTIDVDKLASIDEVFYIIQNQTKYRFLYPQDFFENAPKIQLKKGKIKVSKLLKQSFTNSNVNVELSKDNIIVIKEKPTIQTHVLFDNNNVQGVDISGSVVDSKGIPLAGANIIEKGTNNGAQTDFDGNFSISVTNQDAVLVISYIGFATKEVVANQSNMTITLEESTDGLDEVVIIGYGSSTKKDLVSSVSQIKSDAIENQPVARLDQALQGRASGVEVTSNNGTPGSGATIRIRGNSSIEGNNSPLYVLDGFIVGSGFNLNTINSNDIKSIEILKDATALSIYGVRGAAGVVLITTKNGKGMPTSKPRIAFNHYTSVQKTANVIDILGGQDYVDYINEAGQFSPNLNGGFGGTDSSLPLTFDNPNGIPTTDWLDLIEQTGVVHNTDLSISGNSDHSNYYISINHFDQEGIVRGSGLERVVFRTNVDTKVSDRFKAGVRVNLTNYKVENNKVNYGEIVSAVLPVRTVFDDDGNFTGENPVSSSLQRNPEADIQLRIDHDVITKLITNAYLEYELFKNFKFKSSFGAELTHNKENNYLPGALPERFSGGFARVNTNSQKSILNENTFLYDLDIEKHAFKLLGGFTWQRINNESVRTEAGGFANDASTFNNLETGDPEQFFIDSEFSQRTLRSYLGRLEYGFDSKYLVTLVGRYDESSVFEVGNKGKFFPSIGAAWNVDEENFLSDSNIINKFKLRASYGLVGEQGVGAYNSLSFYDPTQTVFGETIVNGVQVGRLASDGLEWETTKQLDLGIELGFLNNKISLEVDYYNKQTEDLLLRVPISGQTGVASTTQLQNLGTIENKGLEIAINTTNIQNENFTWKTTLTLSGNRSKVLELNGQDFIDLQSTGNQGGASARLIVGETLPSYVGLNYLGTYKNADEIIADGRENISFIGGPRFENLDDNPIWNNEDAQVLGSPEADFYGGFRNSFTYKNLSLDIFFQGSYGNDIFNIRSQASFYGRGDQNVDSRVVNRWIEGVNETSNIPRAGASSSLFNPNSQVNIEDGSFLRLKTMSLAYNVPLENIGLSDIINKLNVYVSGTNLALFSKFKLGDPEVNNFTAGSGLGSVSQGFASGQYPYAGSITMGVKVEF